MGLLQIATKVITNCDRLTYYKLRQIAIGITDCDKFITNCDSYHKLWQNMNLGAAY